MMYADKTVSCVGICQSPMLSIETEMETLDTGQILQITTDKSDLVETVRSWAGENGHVIEEELVASGVTTLIVRKGAAATAEAT
ncbi:sulfurtransferase TusA family protein [Methanoculleus sp. YWC-01]|jgi:TusA-related sulfurtransferase|uniref:Sulfurtransferase TusA family protein n=1 Tax=Methanoculleus nereidis TaxID=2735141 RepID=A0ABU3Z1S0_9EURY|nr:sulfurtransferase TusA family protein [Methanoculleus sp. YWC-01]MCK9298532.1 sulfurtransferase TusA family protein [Methanoculleus sp.]MDV4342753.1 sulfurtransferase TusA family protein [Methanoculleus sp. YWC-01]